MSNETGLDWLARNVHVWPGGDHQPWCYVSFNGRDFSISKFLAVPGVRTCRIDKADWLARRAELQNKPGWDDAPEWAKWLAQDANGSWYFYPDGTRLNSSNQPGMWSHYAEDREAKFATNGEVLGDWRDTLEKRPEEFQPFTGIEDNQEQDMAQQQEMKQDNRWFERGELPPVGVECDIRHSCWNSEKYEKVTVAAITNEYLIVKYATFEQHYMLKDISFRPILTEREAAIEEMKQACPHHGSWDSVGRIYAEALYDAGYRKDPK